jgi:predicted TIM-barrel fold metal-dependent hydrolase
MKLIDAHLHVAGDDPALLALLDRFDIQVLNICVAHSELGDWHDVRRLYAEMAQRYPQRYGWVTSFDLPDYDDLGGWTRRVLEGLARDFDAGAVGCKVWKNVGMEARTPTGAYLMPDDAIFDPIYAFVAERGKTLLTHIAEPYACWQPLVEGTPHYNYYSRHPEWHVAGRADFPTHEQLMAARDGILEKHPTLRVVGAHLGSLEYDVDEVAARLARYPNFAVDVSARLADLAAQESEKVRQLFLRFPDRILFGVDMVVRRRFGEMEERERDATVAALEQRWREYFAYFESSGPVTVGGRTVMGLGLPEDVLGCFYRENALRWYPGIERTGIERR